MLSHLSVAKTSFYFKQLNMHTPTYTTPIFKTEVLCLVAYVCLTVKAN